MTKTCDKTSVQRTPKAETARLLAAGWTDAGGLWRDPRYTGRPGYADYANWSQAIRRQAEYERFDAGLPIYATIKDRNGYGYLLRKCTGAEWKWTTIWRHSDEETVVTRAGYLNEAKTLDAITSLEGGLTLVKDDHVYPYVLVTGEKHGERYFHVLTLDAFRKACLKLVKERNEEGWYEYEDASEIEKPALTKEQVAWLPEGRVRNTAEEEWTEYENQLKRVEGEKHERALLARALKDDGAAAAELLAARKGHEYEGFEIEIFESLEDES